MSRPSLLLVIVLVWAALGSQSRGAAVTKMNLVTDGSSAPPGDRIDLEVFFFPGEDQVTIEVRAFAQLQGAMQIAMVKSNQAAFRDEGGHFRLQQVAKKPDDSRTTSLRLVIPFAAIQVPIGRHRLGYEVKGRRGDTIDFVRATELSLVIVDNKIRTKMKESRETASWKAQRETRSAYVIRDGKAMRQQVEIETPMPAFDFQEREVEVRIPGSFTRPMLAMSMAPEPPASEEEEAKEAALPLAGRPWESLSEFVPVPKRTIFFATNRVVLPDEGLTVKRFGKEAGSLTFGTCLVNIPIENHTKGQLETPGWWNRRDPKKFFLVESLHPVSPAQFTARTSAEDLLLYIHGYNTGFEMAVLRTAQLVHDLQFPGLGMTFSWPSAASLSGYFHDEEMAQASVDPLVELFEKLQESTSAKVERPRKVHAIVHSMGNRIFLQAVRQFELKHGRESAHKLFSQVVLAAPDVDGALFGTLIPSVVRQAEHVTFYYCQTDRALEASQTVHQNKPVGLGPCFADGVDTINAEAVNTDVLGHGYYASAHELLLDLRLVFLYALNPDQRLPPLGQRTLIMGFPHWSFRPVF